MGVKFFPGCPCCGDCACDEAYLRDLFGTSGICPDATVAASPVYVLAEFVVDKSGATNPGGYSLTNIPSSFSIKLRSVQACKCYDPVPNPDLDWCNKYIHVCQGQNFGDNPGYNYFRATYGFGLYIYQNSGSGTYNIGMLPSHGTPPSVSCGYEQDYEGMYYSDFAFYISSVEYGLELYPRSPIVYSDPIPLNSYTCSPKEFNFNARLVNPAIGLSIDCTVKLTITTDCSLIDGDADPWWCTESGCVRSATDPGGALSGPHTTKTICNEACGGVSDVRYWCLYGQCVSGTTTTPHVDAAGPYDTPADCAAACTGPATMVYVCTETGCGSTSKAYAVLNGLTYYTNSADCLAACDSEWYCYDGTCFQWFDLVTPPLYFDSGPYASSALCSADCLGSGPGWYCVDFVCGYYTSAPTGATSGPHATEAICLDNCVVLAVSPFPIEESDNKVVIKPPKMEPPKDDRARALRRFKLPCINRGERTNPGCGCGNKAKFKCSIFGECSLYGQIGDPKAIDPEKRNNVTACANCIHYSNPANPDG